MFRRFLNDRLAVPLVAFLRSYALNYIVGRVPSHRFRQMYYRRVCGMTIGRDTVIALDCHFTGDKLHEIEFGDRVSIPPGAFFVAGAKIKIGDDVVFGHRVELYTSDHDPDDPAFARRDAPIVVEDRAFIASRAIILPGVTVGRGAVVAAGSVVTRDVPPFTIVAGVPARVVRDRGAREFSYRQTGPLPLFY
ncbi:MAG: acetyltransferase [Chloroflexi bacterium]|nr:acetyltransferase [Chloroflexota bacterium]